jgi:hypothetical protein
MITPTINRLAAYAGDALQNLRDGMFHPYRRELHYMRGPGPAWHAKHGSTPTAPAKGPLRLLSALRQTLAEVRENRAKIEAELFRGRYHISSKNDDDLPVVR